MSKNQFFKLPGKEQISPNYSEKISAALMEFAQEIAPADSPPETFERAVSFAVLLWNIPLLPETEQIEAMDEVRELLAREGGLHLQTEIARLLELRKNRYGADRRMVVDYKVEHNAKGPYLMVASLDLDRPENRVSPG